MIEFFTNHTEEFVFYSMYFHFVLYIFWVVSYQWMKNHDSTGTYHRLFHVSFQLRKKTVRFTHQTHSSFMIHLLKSIRRKENRGEDPDGLVFLFREM
ncbi:hypothetical protein [Fervidibacillus albus]|uniref:Uncharacterized protein n=1 Tax=Fervidibacillus albus TaxID=2980026 RepID=A0A9E8RX45_9BACI|nr:hypothetical protein [Fervidibacillus albus]WAA10904.1 hypothetical protein OE104_06210 [Fervidibacillus albus]